MSPAVSDMEYAVVPKSLLEAYAIWLITSLSNPFQGFCCSRIRTVSAGLSLSVAIFCLLL